MVGTDLEPAPRAELPEGSFSDDELAELALAADPDAPLADDAVSLWEVTGRGVMSLLPDWYMPAPMARTRLLRGWRRRVVFGLIIGFLLIDAAGLCFTYGSVVIA